MDAPTNPTTLPCRGAVVSTAALAAAQAWWASGIGADPSTSATVLAPLTLVAAAALARWNRLESRMPVVLVVLSQLLLTVLDLTIGLPGQPAGAVGTGAVLAIALPLATSLLLLLDRHARTRAAAQPPRRGSISYPR